jgi:hypothetical protein
VWITYFNPHFFVWDPATAYSSYPARVWYTDLCYICLILTMRQILIYANHTRIIPLLNVSAFNRSLNWSTWSVNYIQSTLLLPRPSYHIWCQVELFICQRKLRSSHVGVRIAMFTWWWDPGNFGPLPPFPNWNQAKPSGHQPTHQGSDPGQWDQLTPVHRTQSLLCKERDQT